MTESADVIVLGMGPGGEEVAGRLAEAGLDVVGIERALVGGECPYWGCVPSKMIVRAANLLAEARRIPGMAGSATVTPDWAPVARRIREEATDHWDDRVAVERFEGKGGRFVRGEGRLVGHTTVAVGPTTFEAKRGIVIATGSEPVVPPIEGLDGVEYWTNHEAVEAETLPASLAVIGGGAVGLELAQALQRFGVDVTVVEAMERLLPAEEPEASELLAEVLRHEGVALHLGTTAQSVSATEGGIAVALSDGSTVRAERLMLSVGRRIDLARIGAGAVGIDESGRQVPIDERGRLTDRVWALGDVTGGGFTHVAYYQALRVAADILGEPTDPIDLRALPRVTFTDPEVGSVGLTERQARERGIRVRTGLQMAPRSARGWIHKAGNEGVIKVVEDADSGRLIGATSVGAHGGEVLGHLTLAVHAGIPVSTLRSMIYAYPTFHRAIDEALGTLGDG
jgi:pyruvate/2-oxoglutarate dehydrogenase complex dihydrolipoamide dehydrogenase (E3) component